MSDHIDKTIADLQAKMEEPLRIVAKYKAMINDLCEIDGRAPLYADDDLKPLGVGSSASPKTITIKPDEFYGKPLATCVRRVLEMRKVMDLGPAEPMEIYRALKLGNYNFEQKDEENAIRGMQVSISKNTVTFARLPSGKIGLSEWYPGAKAPKQRARNGASEASTAVGSPTPTTPEDEDDPRDPDRAHDDPDLRGGNQ